MAPMIRRLLPLTALASLLLVVACNKGDDLDRIRKDGFGCSKAGAGAGFVAKPGEHCFVCQDDTSMAKCSMNPLTSGCKEDPSGCGKGAK